MKTRRLIFAFGLFSSGLLCVGCRPVAGTRAPGQVAQVHPTRAASVTAVALVKTLTDPRISLAKRKMAEKTLLKMPSEAVLLALVPQVAKGQPAIYFYMGASNELKKDENARSPELQIYFASEYLWGYHNQQSNRAKTHPYVSVSRALSTALPTNAPPAQWSLLNKLWFPGYPASLCYWTADAEKPILALLSDQKTKPDVRVRCLQCLLDKTGMKYYAQCKQVARTFPQNSCQQINGKSDFIAALLNPG